MKKSGFIVLLVGVAGFAAGYFLAARRGRHFREPREMVVRYERGEPRTGHYGAPDLIPERAERAERAELPAVPVVVWTEGKEVIVQKVDTAAIVREYATLYHYSKLLFDNGDGRLTVRAGTQYNRLAYLDYEFTPVREVRTEVRERKWMPFVSAGYGTDESVSVGAGMFFGRVGVEYEWHGKLPGCGLRVPAMKSWHEVSLLWRW